MKTQTEKMKFLIVDDDPDIVEVLDVCLKLRWPSASVLSAGDGEGGIWLTEQEQPDLVILDLNLPDMDGFEVCEAIRSSSNVPIILLTARGDGIDKVKGLELGADDYVTKPFQHLELLARVQAVLRRTYPRPHSLDVAPSTMPPLHVGPISIEPSNREVRMNGKVIRLTPTEYNLLFHLASNAGQVMPHRTLLTKVWGPECADEIEYLKVHIQHLRQKLGDTTQPPRLIITERGVGYRLAAPRVVERKGETDRLRSV